MEWRWLCEVTVTATQPVATLIRLTRGSQKGEEGGHGSRVAIVVAGGVARPWVRLRGHEFQ